MSAAELTRIMITIEKTDLDKRIELLVPTTLGITKIETELALLRRSMQWVEASLNGDWEVASNLESSLSVTPPALELLTLVADPFTARPVRPGRDAPPRTVARYLAAYAETVRLMPKNVHALNQLSETYVWSKRYKEALAATNEMVRLEPGHHLVRRSRIHLMMENYDEAIADVNKHLELNPDDEYIRDTRLRAYLEKGEWQLALDDIGALTGNLWVPKDLSFLRAYALTGLGRLREALTELKKAWQGVRHLLGERAEVMEISKELAAKDPALNAVVESASRFHEWDDEALRIARLMKFIRQELRKAK